MTDLDVLEGLASDCLLVSNGLDARAKSRRFRAAGHPVGGEGMSATERYVFRQKVKIVAGVYRGKSGVVQEQRKLVLVKPEVGRPAWLKASSIQPMEPPQ